MSVSTGLYWRKFAGGSTLGAYDCVQAVQSKPVGYLFGGSRIQYTANVYHHLGQAFQNRNQAAQAAVESLGNLFNVVVTNDMAWVQLSAYNVTIQATSKIDRSNISDIQWDIREKMKGLGYTVNYDSIALLSSPSLEQICGQSGHPSVGATPPPSNPPSFVDKYGYLGLGAAALMLVLLFRR